MKLWQYAADYTYRCISQFFFLIGTQSVSTNACGIVMYLSFVLDDSHCQLDDLVDVCSVTCLYHSCFLLLNQLFILCTQHSSLSLISYKIKSCLPYKILMFHFQRFSLSAFFILNVSILVSYKYVLLHIFTFDSLKNTNN